MLDLDFQGNRIKIEFFLFIVTVGFAIPENILIFDIFKQFCQQGKNQGGGTHLSCSKLIKYLGMVPDIWTGFGVSCKIRNPNISESNT